MQIRLTQKIRDVTSSVWFIPSVLTLVGLAAAVFALRLDTNPAVQDWTERNAVLFTSGEGARALLATLAGSSISVAGVIFSITIVVLNMAAAQFGPGLLGKFMRHRGTQTVLGLFVATFTYCLIVMRFVHEDGGFVPHISANIGLLLGLVSFFMLIYFIYHVSEFIQVARVIDDVATKLEKAFLKNFPERESEQEHAPDEEVDDELVCTIEDEGVAVNAETPGYLEAIDQDRLKAIATKKNMQILLQYRPGHFVIQDAAIAKVVPAGAIDDTTAAAIRQCLAFGPERSLAQDPEFAVRQLVEIALRSLSPSVNDPFTALNCIDRLVAALALLAKRKLRSRYIRDDDNKVRVVTNPLTYTGIVDAAFNQIRQTAENRAAVTFRILDLIAELGHRELPESFRAALKAQLDAIREENSNAFQNEFDRKQYLARLKKSEKSVLKND